MVRNSSTYNCLYTGNTLDLCLHLGDIKKSFLVLYVVQLQGDDDHNKMVELG